MAVVEQGGAPSERVRVITEFLPVLQWLGMTGDEARAEGLGVPAYPHMVKWVLD